MSAPSDVQSVCYQGINGSHSYSLANIITPQARRQGFLTFYEAMEAVEQQTCDMAIIPIENNIGGRVAEIHHLLFNTTLKIVAEYFVQIDHYLLGSAGSSIESITHVYSHPQALLQCREFLHTQRLNAIAELDTAVAAKAIAQHASIQHAAIAPLACAEIYGLHIIATDIANHTENITRFIAMRREQHHEISYTQPITALLFQIRSVPSALYKALGGFATAGINILKLESYVEPPGFDIAQFYVEVAADIQAHAHTHALDELKYFAEWVKVIGVFEQNRVPIVPTAHSH